MGKLEVLKTLATATVLAAKFAVLTIRILTFITYIQLSIRVKFLTNKFRLNVTLRRYGVPKDLREDLTSTYAEVVSRNVVKSVSPSTLVKLLRKGV